MNDQDPIPQRPVDSPETPPVNYAGRFIWCELLTPDVAASRAFYAAVVGWTAKEMGAPGPAYTIMSAGDGAVAGIQALSAEARAAGGAPGWTGYIAVDDVDVAVAELEKLGGGVQKPAMDLQGVGRLAAVSDPQGAPFVLFKPTPPPGGAPGPLPEGTPRSYGWRDLDAVDGQTAWTFYEALFGWQKRVAVDMGEAGT